MDFLVPNGRKIINSKQNSKQSHPPSSITFFGEFSWKFSVANSITKIQKIWKIISFRPNFQVGCQKIAGSPKEVKTVHLCVAI
jgi:hypothetical protein